MPRIHTSLSLGAKIAVMVSWFILISPPQNGVILWSNDMTAEATCKMFSFLELNCLYCKRNHEGFALKFLSAGRLFLEVYMETAQIEPSLILPNTCIINLLSLYYVRLSSNCLILDYSIQRCLNCSTNNVDFVLLILLLLGEM